MKTFYSLSKTIAFHAATSSVDLGNAGERLAIALFSDNGFKAKKQTERYKGDIEVLDPKTGEIIRVEVKTARKSTVRENLWQFCLNKAGFTSCSYSQFCLFFVVMKGEIVAYLVPNSVIAGKKQLNVTDPKKYRGMIAPYKINHNSVSFDAQLELLEMA